jgi:hypothetical protein
MSRPSEFSEEIADLICELLADGKKLEEICAREEMPAASTIFRWLAAHPEFEKHYGMARRAYAHRLEDESIEIADNVGADQPPTAGEGMPRAASYVAVQRDKLRIETRRWLIRRLAPRRYGRRDTRAVEGAWDASAGPIEVEYTE